MKRSSTTPRYPSAAMEETTVKRAHTKFTGLRAGIPATYARELGLQADDKITWELDKDEQGKYLKVRKKEGKAS